MHLDRGSVGRLAHPYVEVLPLSGFEEHDIVAVVKLGKLVELVQLRFRVEFDVLAAMRQQSIKVVEKVPMPFKIQSQPN